jgi:hypothetical protein
VTAGGFIGQGNRSGNRHRQLILPHFFKVDR